MLRNSRWAAVLLPVVGILPWVAGCEKRNEYVAPPPPEVSVAKPIERDVVDYIDFTGTTRALATVEIRARVNGYLESIHFTDGANVEKGQLLFVLEQAPFETALAAAKANLQKAQAALKLAEAEIRRITPLVKRGAMPEQDLDIKTAERATAAAEVAGAQAAIDEANLNLQYTRIEAPMAGRISRHMVDVGNLVQSQSTLLTTIENYQPVHAYFYLAEDDLLRFMEMRREQNLPSIQEQSITLHMGLEEGDGYPYEGKLDFAELGVDPDTGTAMRRGVFPNENMELVPGLFVRLRAAVGEPKPRLLVSARAVAADQRGNYLLVVNDENVVEYRPVKLGITEGGLSVVEDGIKPGESVIVNGLQRARPGAKVNPQPAEQIAVRDSENSDRLSSIKDPAKSASEAETSSPASVATSKSPNRQ